MLEACYIIFVCVCVGFVLWMCGECGLIITRRVRQSFMICLAGQCRVLEELCWTRSVGEGHHC